MALKNSALLGSGLAVALGATAGWVDQHVKPVQITVLVIGFFAFTLSLAIPRRAWLWGLIIGLFIPLSGLVGAWAGHTPPYPPHPWYEALPALIPAMLGAGLGSLLGSQFFPQKRERRQ